MVFSSFNGTINGSGVLNNSDIFSMNIAKVIEGETYTITNGTSNQLVYAYFNEIPVIGATSYNNTRMVVSNHTITAEITGYIAFRTDINYETPQIEEGTKATPYEPHQEQSYPLNLGDIEFCKIGSYQDFPYRSNGKCYKHKGIGKVVLDGTEVFNIESKWTVTIYSNALCNNYICRGNYYVINSEGKINNSITFEANGQISISNSQYTNVEDFKTWLSTHNVIVYYVLQNSIEEEITNETVISQLEAIYNGAKSYKGQTHIYTETDGINPYIEAEYSIDNIENTANKVTSIDENSTNQEYPTAKAVYDYVKQLEDRIKELEESN